MNDPDAINGGVTGQALSHLLTFLVTFFSKTAGISHGHTGHVRCLTCVEATPEGPTLRSRHPTSGHRYSQKGAKEPVGVLSSGGSNAMSLALSHATRMLVISGGDGYEDFRHTAFSDGSSVGREDSTNHLLLWQV